MSASELTLTLFGMGVWGGRVARILLAEGVTLDVVDSDPGVEKSALEAGARSFSTRTRVAPDSRGIVIATPSTTHFALIRELAGRRLPMYVEKPLTTDPRQARELAARHAGDIFVMHTWLYHPGVELLADISNSGELGDLLYLRTQRVNWTSPRRDTDTVWTLLPHDLTIVRAVLGYFPRARFAVAEIHERVPRGLVCIMGDRPHVVIEISNRFWRKGREIRAHFTGGSVSLKDEKTPYLEVVHGHHRTDADAARVERRAFPLEPDPLTAELASFLGFLEDGPPPRSSLEDGVEVVERVAEIRELAKI